MGDTSIEWTDKTWNPTRGCSRVSEGCRNCYAERRAARFCGKGQPYEGLAVQRQGSKWTGEVRLVPEKLAEPLRWKRPRRVFVNSMSDLFHENLCNPDIAAVFGVMAAAPQHTFQVLTKRPERMREWFAWIDGGVEGPASICGDHVAEKLMDTGMSGLEVDELMYGRIKDHRPWPCAWPLPNLWLGVSVEDQATADERIPVLLETPAAIRFVSYEPALGPIDLSRWDPGRCDCETCAMTSVRCTASRHPIDWIIAGSESGPRARPAELDWFRSVRDQCAAAGVPFFFKQWVGAQFEGVPMDHSCAAWPTRKVSLPILDGRQHVEWPTGGP